jgi:hypothetical protein
VSRPYGRDAADSTASARLDDLAAVPKKPTALPWLPRIPLAGIRGAHERNHLVRLGWRGAMMATGA